MFIGEYIASVTAGNRVAVPKTYRSELGPGTLIVTKGYEGCLVLVKKESFMHLLEGVTDKPFILADKRETSRFLLSGAHEVGSDKQGRITLPETLITYAGIDSTEVTFLGVGNWIEVWDTKRWQKYQQQLQANSSDIAQRLSNLGSSD